MSTSTLEVDDLTVTIATHQGERAVVQNASLTIGAGRSLGIVGESGAGKSMLIRAILGEFPVGLRVRVRGSVRIAGIDLTTLPPRQRRRALAESVGLIHQDPLRSLNPTIRVGSQLLEASRGASTRSTALEALRALGFPAPEVTARRYAHELSGGQRQRIGIAAATVAAPSLIIGDEPTTALDVTVQRQVLDMLDARRREQQAALLMVTHDLGVAAERCDDLAVMRSGRIVEYGPTTGVLTDPQHPYTRALLASIPRIDGPRPRRLPVLEQEFDA